jgi:hypothetical protein
MRRTRDNAAIGAAAVAAINAFARDMSVLAADVPCDRTV